MSIKEKKASEALQAIRTANREGRTVVAVVIESSTDMKNVFLSNEIRNQFGDCYTLLDITSTPITELVLNLRNFDRFDLGQVFFLSTREGMASIHRSIDRLCINIPPQSNQKAPVNAFNEDGSILVAKGSMIDEATKQMMASMRSTFHLRAQYLATYFAGEWEHFGLSHVQQ